MLLYHSLEEILCTDLQNSWKEFHLLKLVRVCWTTEVLHNLHLFFVCEIFCFQKMNSNFLFFFIIVIFVFDAFQTDNKMCYKISGNILIKFLKLKMKKNKLKVEFFCFKNII